MHPAEVIETLRQWWAWVGAGYGTVGQVVVTIATVGIVIWLPRKYLPKQWVAATKWAEGIVARPLGAESAAKLTKVIQAIPALVVSVCLAVLLEGGDLGEALKIALYGALSPFAHEFLKAYKGGSYPAAGSLKPQAAPMRLLGSYDGDDAPSDPPPPNLPPVAALPLLLAIGFGYLSGGCTASLGEAKSVAMRGKYGGQLTEIPSKQCRDLDYEHRVYGNVSGATYVLGAGIAAGAVAVPEDVDHRVAVQRSMVISAAVLAGAAEAARQLSDARKTEWAEKCSIIGGAK